MGLREAQVHIAPSFFTKKRLRSVVGKVSRRYRCKRCSRDLPDDQFLSMGYSINKQVLYLHPFCHRCRAQLTSVWVRDPMYSPALHHHCKLMVGRAKSASKQRGMVCAISADDAMGMYINQQGLCAISGVRMTIKPRSSGPKDLFAASIDRIDSACNYTLDNVHLVTVAVNLMKSDMSINTFKFWCATVAIREARRK